MSKTTMTVLAAVGAVIAVLVLGVVIGFAVDSDDVDVATDSVSDERSGGDDSDGDPGSGDFSDGDGSEPPVRIEGLGDFIECLGDAGLGLEDIQEFDMDFGEFFSECIGGLLPENFRDPFGDDELDPFGGLEEFFEEGGEGGLGGLEDFFNEFEEGGLGGLEDFFNEFEEGGLGGLEDFFNEFGDGFDGFSERFEDGSPFGTGEFEDFWNDLFDENSDTNA